MKITDELKGQIKALSDALKAAGIEAPEPKDDADDKEILAAVKAMQDQLKAFEESQPKVEAKYAPPGIVTDTSAWKYDNVKTEDLALTIEVLGEMARKGYKSQSGRAAQPAKPGAYKALAMRLGSAEALKDEGLAHAAKALKSANIPDSVIKANELNHTTQASYGDEWIGVAYSGQLWESIRNGTPVFGRIPQSEFPSGAESLVIPLESADPTWYLVNQATGLNATTGRPDATVNASKLGTDNRTVTLKKLGARTVWSGEMDEDSVLPFAAQLRQQFAVSGAEMLESAVIDGDTATGATTNINDIAGTPAGNEYFLAFDGFRKIPLITTTANSRSAGTLAAVDYLETAKLLGAAGASAVDMTKVSFIVDLNTYWKSLELAEVKTRDVNSAATIETGRLVRMYGYDVIASAHMHKLSGDRKANTAGKIDQDTAANNTTGSILAVRWDQWRFFFRRRMTIETTRYAEADATQIVAMMRGALRSRDDESASAISYGVTLTEA